MTPDVELVRGRVTARNGREGRTAGVRDRDGRPRRGEVDNHPTHLVALLLAAGTRERLDGLGPGLVGADDFLTRRAELLARLLGVLSEGVRHLAVDESAESVHQRRRTARKAARAATLRGLELLAEVRQERRHDGPHHALVLRPEAGRDANGRIGVQEQAEKRREGVDETREDERILADVFGDGLVRPRDVFLQPRDLGPEGHEVGGRLRPGDGFHERHAKVRRARVLLFREPVASSSGKHQWHRPLS